MNYPPNCFRGIADYPKCIDNNGQPNARIFKPHSNQQPNEKGWLEFSINWEDDNIVEELTRHQRKPDGRLHFVNGIVRMKREMIDNLKKMPACRGFLDYERYPLDDNPYHGRILIKAIPNDEEKSKALQKAIAGQLVTTIIGNIIPPPETEQD